MPRQLLGVPLLAILVAPALAASPGADDWKYDVVLLKNNKSLRGLVVEQCPRDILLKCVWRRPGRPTIVISEWVPRREIARLALAEPAERALLAQRLAALSRERQLLETRLKAVEPANRPDGESGVGLALRGVPWIGDEKRQALAYESTYFRLISNAKPVEVELAAIHLEQIYAAYASALPPHVARAGPTTIVLTRSTADYQGLTRRQGFNLKNPAFFDAARNRVFCGSDLQRLGDELARCRRRHDRLRDELKKTETELGEAYSGKTPPEILSPIVQARKEMQACDQRNEAAFQKARRRLLQRLCHEAFHAYVVNHVYPAGEGELPRWLNEGLAQIFETAIVEVGELRVGHADKERLDAVRSALARDEWPPLADLLRAGPRQFLIAHAADRPESDRSYLASWALAFHLTFERRLLGTPALDDYTRALHRGVDPLLAFRDLVGQPLPAFEKEYREYLAKLKQDGSTR